MNLLPVYPCIVVLGGFREVENAETFLQLFICFLLSSILLKKLARSRIEGKTTKTPLAKNHFCTFSHFRNLRWMVRAFFLSFFFFFLPSSILLGWNKIARRSFFDRCLKDWNVDAQRSGYWAPLRYFSNDTAVGVQTLSSGSEILPHSNYSDRKWI